MRISEIISEQIAPMGTVGSTAGSPGQVPTVSQTPASTAQPNKADPNQEKIAKLLMPHGIKDPADLNNATAALQKAMTSPNQLNAQQQELLGKLVNPLMKDQSFATALKQLSMQKPGQAAAPQTTPPPMGAAPGATV